MADNVARALADVVGSAHVLTDETLTASYETDWTGRFSGRARAVVRPVNTEQVTECVRLCAAAGESITPQGGNTGLVGGSVPVDGGVLLSLRRLSGIAPVDRSAGQVSAGAGATLGSLQRHVRAAGWDFGVDLASRDSATLGGMVGTNAGGIRVIRHGSMRRQVLGVEAVLADGSVVRRMSGLVKDNVGYDLPGLLTGSEGTLAVVTEMRLRLVPRHDDRAVALIGVDDATAAVEWVGALRRRTDLLDAAELMFADGIDLVCRTTGLRQPLVPAPPAYLLVEIAGAGADERRLAELIDAAGEPRDAVLAGDAAGRAGLWRYREAHPEAVGTQGIELKLDVAVHLHLLAELVDRVRAVTDAMPAAATYLYGHIAEGSLHVNVVGPAVEEVGAAERLTDAVFGVVAALGGSISAEHGVGRAKRSWLHLSRGPAEIAAMRALKAALDPTGMLNPGVLLPPTSTVGPMGVPAGNLRAP